MLDDAQLVMVTFSCCGHQAVHHFGALKTSPIGFVCPACNATAQYDRHEYVALLNKEPEDPPFKISLYPVE